MSVDDKCVHLVVYCLHLEGISTIHTCLVCDKGAVFEPKDYEKIKEVYLSKWKNYEHKLRTYDIYRRKKEVK